MSTSWSEKIAALQDKREYQTLNWEGSFDEYLDLVRGNPRVTRTAYQRVYDMILSHGKTEYIDNKKRLVRYHFFSDEKNGGRDAVFGLDVPLMKLVNVFKAAAHGYGAEKRVILLHGPVGSSKSTIARVLKRGIENYSRTDDGAVYTYSWNFPEKLTLADGSVLSGQIKSPLNDEPLKLIPRDAREQLFAELAPPAAGFSIPDVGELNPHCRLIFKLLLQHYHGDLTRLLGHVRVHRLVFSEKDRVGIGTFQPKDEKNQDSTELTGDINYRRIAEYGSDSDPRAFNFDGEFCVANRGVIEFVEMLKLDVAFLYDLLGATQEHKIKPKKFPQTDIDEVIIGHTNEPEFKKLESNEFMEALRDRTIKIDIPYITKLSEEIKIYEKEFNEKRIRGKRIAPHTLEMAAMWAVLTRLEDPRKHNLSLIQKLKLYNGKRLPNFTEDNIKELRKESLREGLDGISPRYIQDKISNALVSDKSESSINPFMVLNELETGLKQHSLIASEELRKKYREQLNVVKQEYEDIVKNEVQRAISSDEESIVKLFGNYIDNVKAYTQKEKIKNKYTGLYDEPDERLMRAIEEKIDISDSMKDDFRLSIILSLVGTLGSKAGGREAFSWRSDERLRKGLELKLFEDQKDSIKLKTLVSSVVDNETQEKIDVVKGRLIKDFGYDDESATDVLNFVASIFARGDAKE